MAPLHAFSGLFLRFVCSFGRTWFRGRPPENRKKTGPDGWNRLGFGSWGGRLFLSAKSFLLQPAKPLVRMAVWTRYAGRPAQGRLCVRRHRSGKVCADLHDPFGKLRKTKTQARSKLRPKGSLYHYPKRIGRCLLQSIHPQSLLRRTTRPAGMGGPLVRQGKALSTGLPDPAASGGYYGVVPRSHRGEAKESRRSRSQRRSDCAELDGGRMDLAAKQGPAALFRGGEFPDGVVVPECCPPRALLRNQAGPRPGPHP